MAGKIESTAGDTRRADVQQVLDRYHVFYEVRPYYVVLDERPAGAPRIEQKVQAGFDVNLYGILQTSQFPVFHTEDGRLVLDYFGSVAREIQATAGHGCTVELMPETDSVVRDTRRHFQPEAMLRIRISHDRGLDQPAGPPEQQALQAIRNMLHEFNVKEE
jgi:hypothetical protein